MNGPAKCASGAGAGSAATEPRSRVSSGLGAPAPFHSESRPQRSASGVEDPAGVGGVSTWVTIGLHVGGVFVSTCTDPFGGAAGHGACNRSADLAAFLASAARKERQRLEALGIAVEIGAQRRLQRRARPEGNAQTSFPRQRRRRLPRRTNPLPDSRQAHRGCVFTRRTVSERILSRSWTRWGPR